jgi:hypothetical protein
MSLWSRLADLAGTGRNLLGKIDDVAVRNPSSMRYAVATA